MGGSWRIVIFLKNVEECARRGQKEIAVRNDVDVEVAAPEEPDEASHQRELLLLVHLFLDPLQYHGKGRGRRKEKAI